MKTLFLLMFTGVLTFAQNDTLLEALKYYPLQEGNYWEYAVYSYQIIPYYEDSSFYSIEVTGDTVLSNYKSYKILSRKNIPFDGYVYRTYERIDSGTACLYRFTTDTAFTDNEYLCDSLLADSGDYFAGSYTPVGGIPGYLSTICTGEFDDEVFNILTSIKKFEDQSGIPATSYTFAKGFGFVSSLACEYGCGEVDLRYATIDSIEYGIQVTDIKDENNLLSKQFVLYQNYPNPFNPSTTLSFVIGNSAFVTLKVYDVLGNEVATLVNGEKPAGDYQVNFDASKLASGIYFYQLKSDTFVQTKKMILLN